MSTSGGTCPARRGSSRGASSSRARCGGSCSRPACSSPTTGPPGFATCTRGSARSRSSARRCTAAIVADSYVHFGLADVAVPFASSWKPVAVAWGVVRAYLLLAVQASSLLMRRIPRRAWRAIHLLSYALFATVSVHAFTAGTDRTSDVFQAFGIAVVAVMMGATVLRAMHRGSPRTRLASADAA